MLIISKVKYAQPIPIIRADGKADSVNLQARSRLQLPSGAKLDPSKIGLILGSITIVEPTSAPAEEKSSAPAAVKQNQQK